MHGIGGQAAFGQRLLHQPRQGLVGVNRFRTTPQDAGVAAFDGQAGRLDRHVGTALENHAEHANGHTHLTHANAAGLLLHANDFANHVRHGGQLLAALRACFQYLGAELEAVHHGGRQTGGNGPFQVFGVIGLQRSSVAAQQFREATQRGILDRSAGARHDSRSHFGLSAQRLGQFGDVDRIHPNIFA